MNSDYEGRQRLIIELSSRNDWSIIKEEVESNLKDKETLVSTEDIKYLYHLYSQFCDKEYQFPCTIKGKLIVFHDTPYSRLDKCHIRAESIDIDYLEYSKGAPTSDKDSPILWNISDSTLKQELIPDLANFNENLLHLSQKYLLEDFEILRQLNKYIECVFLDKRDSERKG